MDSSETSEVQTASQEWTSEAMSHGTANCNINVNFWGVFSIGNAERMENFTSKTMMIYVKMADHFAIRGVTKADAEYSRHDPIDQSRVRASWASGSDSRPKREMAGVNTTAVYNIDAANEEREAAEKLWTSTPQITVRQLHVVFTRTIPTATRYSIYTTGIVYTRAGLYNWVVVAG